MTPPPGTDQPLPGRSSTDRPTTDEATAVPSSEQPTPEQPSPGVPSGSDRPDPETRPGRDGSPDRGPDGAALPMGTVLDGYFWERRRRSAVVPIAVGVLGLTALGLVQELPMRHVVEQDLADRSTQALKAAGVQGVDVRFSGRDGTLSGTVTSPAERDSAMNAVRRVSGVRVAHDRLAGPRQGGNGSGTARQNKGQNKGHKPGTAPSTGVKASPQITARLQDGRLTLAGSVPSSAARADLVAAARTAVHPQRLSSRISVDGQLSPAGLDGLAAVLHALGPDADVTVELRDGRLALAGGVASTRQIRQAVTAGAALTGDPTRVINRLAVDQRVAVAAALRALPAITFRTAYSTPTERDEVLLRRLAGVLKANPEVQLQVLGYTDDVGDADMNYGLSYARARTVYRELQQLGIPASRLSFRAFGEKNPKLPNTTPDNRAANRRVEFRVIPQA
jgi:OOP family OmpA-OmpF porin